jgi:hypothetical protein
MLFCQKFHTDLWRNKMKEISRASLHQAARIMDRKRRAEDPQALTEEEEDELVEQLAEVSECEEETKRMEEVLAELKRRHYHQSWLAGQANVNPSSISMWKKGLVSKSLKERINGAGEELLAEGKRLRAADAAGSKQPRLRRK